LLNSIKSTYFKFLAFGLYILSVITLNLSGVSGYNINDNLALVDRYFQTNRFFYSGGFNDLFVGTPSYFPGNAFLLYFIRIFTFEYAVEIACLISGIWVVLFVLMSILKSTELSSNNILGITMIPLVLITFFPAWIWYAIDSKPDTFLVGLFLGVTIILNKKEFTLIKTITLFIFAIIGTVTKQQFLALYISTIIYLYYVERDIFFKRLIPLFIGGLIGVIIIFSIENVQFYTIEIQKQRHFQPLSNILKMLLTVLKNSWVIFILIIFYLKFLRKNTQSEKGLLISAVIWFIMSFMGAIHVGGTVENIYSGLLLTLPFVITSLCYFINHSGKVKVFFLNYSALFLFIISLISVGGNFVEGKIIRNKKYEVIKYLNSHFKNKKALFDGSTYSIIRETSLNPISEIDVVMNFESANINTSMFYDLLMQGKYDVIITSDDKWKSNKNLSTVIDNFFILDSSFEARTLKVFVYKYKKK
jgi:hypothetical protein